jgi:2-polyprenyl-6-methoxyphenol hydroxylase-like FAD-dependent oxidoreductase
MDATVLVVGAGPTGLVLALWLTKLGVKIQIVDKAAEAGTTSRAIAVQARTLEFYRQLGIADLVVDASARINAANLWVGGRRAARLVLGDMGRGLSPFPYALSFAQDAHERLLIERLAQLGVRVERPVELLRFEQSADGVRSVLRHADGSEEACDTAYIAGCDGGHSAVRRTLGLEFAGSTYSGVFFVADVEAAGPAADGDIHVDIEDFDFLAVFPLKGAGRMRLIGPLAGATEDIGDAARDEVRRRAQRHLALDVARLNWFSTYRVHHRVASRFRVGRAFLLGDAAHIHSPVGGQGMNTGIGDAVNLAWKLAAVLRGEASDAADELLATYEPERIAFARRLVATTDRAFTFITKQGPLARVVRRRIAPSVLSLFFRVARFRRLAFQTVSQIGVSYPGEWISEGVAAKVHGGDRLPWVEVGNGRGNFDALVSLDWQVHVYGQVGESLREACRELRLPLHIYAWREEAGAAGLARDALYLVRPDGYVALADATGTSARLRAYVAAHRVR